jgi:mono/diheme cytochrome c family protein
MAARRSAARGDVLAGLLFLLSLAGWPLLAPAAIRAQADSPRAAAGTAATGELFRQLCVKCHGADGTGSTARSLQPEVPDFTVASWQARRGDAELQASILDGKGKDMPPFRGKVNEDQARDLVARVRAFAPTAGKPGPRQQQPAAPPSGFDGEWRRLEQEMDESKRQFPERGRGSADRESSKPSDRERPKPSTPSPRPAPSQPSAPAVAETPTARELFRQHCVKCHGADGTGNDLRRRQPEIPNFTDPAWHARRTDAQLLVSILDGKGKEMPPSRGKLSAEQARALAGYVRAFAPATGTPQGGPQAGYPGSYRDLGEVQEEHAPAEPAEAEPPRGFIPKLIGWLGKFHSPVVHFPIALLTAAAVAELLRLVTGQPAFDAASCYCVWFGALSAAVAGVLGWFWGVFA